jgi:hypothetical protein
MTKTGSISPENETVSSVFTGESLHPQKLMEYIEMINIKITEIADIFVIY